MKLKHLFASFVAALGIFASCTPEGPTYLDEVQVSSSWITIDAEGGSATINLVATADWAVSDAPSWLTVSPASGSAGDYTLTLTATPADNHSAEVEKDFFIVSNGKKLGLKVVQGAAFTIANTPETAYTADEAIQIYLNGKDLGTQIYVKGVVKSASIDLNYGNAEFYLEENSDDYSFEFYRCLDFEGVKFTDDKKVKKGDIITAYGTLTKYNSTIEFAQGCILVSIESGAAPEPEKPTEIEYTTIGSIAKEGTYSIKDAVVMAVAGSDVILGDATGFINLYKSNHGLHVGNVISMVNQDVTLYNGGFQLGSGTEFTVADIAGTVTPDYGTAKDLMTEEDITSHVANPFYQYIHFIGTVAEDGKHRNIFCGDPANKKGIYLSAATDAAFDGKLVEVYGFAKGDAAKYGTITTTLVSIKEVEGVKSLAHSSWRYDIPEDSDNGFMVVTFEDESNVWMVTGDKEGYWWEDSFFEGTYTYDAETNLGMAFDVYGFEILENGNLNLGGLYEMHQIEYVEKHEGEDDENPYAIKVSYTLGANAYDDGAAIINGVEVAKTLKIGTSKKAGEFTVTLPAGTSELSFYAVAWKGSTDASFTLLNQTGSEWEPLHVQDINANDGATGNPAYTITCTEDDHYTLDFAAALGSKLSSDMVVKFTSDVRVLFFGMQTR